MKLLKIKNKKGESCYVTKRQFVEYQRKGREVTGYIESRPYGQDSQEPVFKQPSTPRKKRSETG